MVFSNLLLFLLIRQCLKISLLYYNVITNNFLDLDDLVIIIVIIKTSILSEFRSKYVCETCNGG